MLPRFSRLRKRPTVASGRKVGRLESSVMPTSRIDITCMGMSNDVETAGSVCEMAMRVTVRSAPATVLTTEAPP